MRSWRDWRLANVLDSSHDSERKRNEVEDMDNVKWWTRSRVSMKKDWKASQMYTVSGGTVGRVKKEENKEKRTVTVLTNHTTRHAQ